jgi:hypothetical protein
MARSNRETARLESVFLFLKRERNIREPTVTALGLFGSCAGLRADLIVADDIIDSELCFRRQRDRVHQWLVGTHAGDEADSRILVGRKHFDDLYSRAIPPTGIA